MERKKNENTDLSHRPKDWEKIISSSDLINRKEIIADEGGGKRFGISLSKNDFNLALRELSFKQLRVLRMILEERLRPSEIAEKLSISRVAVVKIRDRAFMRMGKIWAYSALGVSPWEV